jgi:hypothetical protein
MFTFDSCTEGPLGFPMNDRSARHVDGLLRSLPRIPEHAYRHLITAKSVDVQPGERSDISWISTESVDRVGEVVLAAGMDDSQFRDNPLVTLAHRYDLPPVGRSVWRQRARDGQRGLSGIRAKTHYPPAPPGWPSATAWTPDQVLALIEAGLLQGKSIGFLPTRVHAPTRQEAQRNGWSDDVHLVIDEWLLLEYACVTLPANQDSLVQAVAKGNLTLSEPVRRALDVSAAPQLPRAVAFSTLAEVERAVRSELLKTDFASLARRSLESALARLRGRV